MIGTGKGKNRRTGSLLLLILFGLGLASLALPEAAESGVATAWVRSYNAGTAILGRGVPVNGTAYAMVVDGQGNVHVAGSSYGPQNGYATIKYDSKGRRLWQRHYGRGRDPAALALDGQGNVCITGSEWGVSWLGTGSSNYVSVKYDPHGRRLWGRFYSGPNAPYSPSWDAARAMVVDGQGNVLVTGESSTPETGPDFLTIKYGPDGKRLWLRRFNGGVNDRGYAYSDGAVVIAVDGQGNAYVAGSSYDGVYYRSDVVTLKYSPDGEMLWMRRYNGPGDTDDSARALALDSQGNVYVIGRSTAPGAQSGGYNYDYLTIKYSPDGEELWNRRYNGPGNGSDKPVALAVDDQDNIYITGSSQGVAGEWNSNYYATVKYSPAGEELWVRRYNGPGNSSASAKAMALDAQGNVYVTGASYNAVNTEIATIKYSPDGETLWVMRYDSPGDRYDSPAAIAVDSQDNVYVTGTSCNDPYKYYPSVSYYVTIKYIQTPRQGR